VRAAADAAAGVRPRRELWLALLLIDHALFSQGCSSF